VGQTEVDLVRSSICGLDVTVDPAMRHCQFGRLRRHNIGVFGRDRLNACYVAAWRRLSAQATPDARHGSDYQ
jgi:hypothetical protein